MEVPHTPDDSALPPPKRSSRKNNKKRILITTFILILVNVGATGILARQIVARTAVVDDTQVKADSTTLPAAGDVTSENAPEDLSLATDNKPLITTYTVVSGDTLGGIAEQFDISTNTIRWANNLSPTAPIHVGDKLTILPVTGIAYTVAKGDTISGIAVKFNVDQADILDFNNLDSADKIMPGVQLIIPDGKPVTAPKPVIKKSVPAPSKSSTTNTPVPNTSSVSSTTSSSSSGYFIAPLSGSVLSQGLHDGTAVDMAHQTGGDVRAAAAGVVTLAKDSNTWNGGYGYYITIKHDNGTETLYAHLSRIDVEVGQTVAQGEHIALSGNTGHTTGPHLHFEVHGAPNPFAKDKLGTKY